MAASNLFTIEELNALFAHKRVRITHVGNSNLLDGEGVCKEFHATGSGVDIELTNGARRGFIPDSLTSTTVEGYLGVTAGRRKVEVVNDAFTARDELEITLREFHGILAKISPDERHLVWEGGLAESGQALYDLLKSYVAER